MQTDQRPSSQVKKVGKVEGGRRGFHIVANKGPYSKRGFFGGGALREVVVLSVVFFFLFFLSFFRCA